MSKTLSEELQTEKAHKHVDTVTLDRFGMILSVICLIHCLITPLLLISLPILARYYLAHPMFHLMIALLIVPVGLMAFYSGYKHHRNKTVLLLGIPGLFIIAAIPYLVHEMHYPIPEAIVMTLGSVMMLSAHWINRKSCKTCKHHHH